MLNEFLVWLKNFKPVKTEEPVKVGEVAPIKKKLTPYEWAQNELKTQNTREIPGSKDNPRIIWYHSHTSLEATDDETPWCSAFMCTCAEETGHKSTKSASASSWIKYGAEGSGEVGDIVVFKRAGGHHVAFVNKPYRKGDQKINILGGNQGNRLCIEDHDTASLITFRKFKEA